MMVAEDVYALKNLLPAGVVRLFFSSTGAIATQPPAIESDDWNALTPFLEAHRLHVTTSSLPRLHELDFLVLHRYVRATWRLPEDDLCGFVHVRVYVIPFDLPGAHGLRVTHYREKQKVMLNARKAFISLLTETNRYAGAWVNYAEPCDGFEPFLSQQHDSRTLSEIYSDLPSPAVDPSTFLSGADLRTQRAFRRALYWESPPEMRPLYTYQRRTVARMLQQELDPGIAPDPLYIPIHGVQLEGSAKCKTFYLQPSTMEALSECPMRSQAKGGILCEEMGTGKTCIVLGLIMATKHQLSSPEEPLWDEPERPILTPLAFRHFPTRQFECARQVARIKDRPSGIPSLVETLTHFIRASPELISPPGFNDSLKERLPAHLWESLMENHPFYHVFERDPATASSRRKFFSRGPRKVFLTSATLVIVPRAILEQWNFEINKHCEDGSIRHILLDIGPKPRPMPSAQKLASMYDIVLMTHEKFAAEKPRCDPSSLHSWTQCQCPMIGRSRVPRCTCHLNQNRAPVSPLIQIRWKRLVVDEGHVSAAANNLARLCQELNVERRWIVSGTPTRNLMGLSLGQSESPETVEDFSTPYDKVVEEKSSIVDDEEPIFDGELGYPSDPIKDPPRVWTRVDRDDLVKLSEMISKFIGVPQFAHEANSFRKFVAAPLLDRNGPGLGATQVVSQVMSQVMFRHQIQDVERELPEKLPPLKEKTVALKFHPLAAKTYNVLQAGIAVNAVDSQRRDQDYLFHPMARAALRQTLENLTQTMFWRTDHTIFDIEGALKRSQEALQTALKRNLPDSDIKLVEDSIKVQREALEDGLWTAVMGCDDNPFVVRGLSSALQAAWLKMDVHLFENRDALLDPDRLCKLRDVLLRSPLISEHGLIGYGFTMAEEEVKLAALYEESQRRSKRKTRLDEGGVTESLKVKRFNVIEQGITQELTAVINRRERGDIGGHASVSFEPTPSAIGNFSSISIGKSASSKVNYIIRKVRKHAAKEKFLIFSAFPLSLAYVEDALRLAQVRYLKYTSGIKPHHRQQSVVTFETSEKYRVLLMELKLGARGLNLVKASRIIFCEPVWQGDVESQAIKRAHRIGQTCSVLKVTTLVMRGTSEEAMVTRRHALRRKSERLPAMEEDASLSRFLQNPTFTRPEDIEGADVPSLVMPLISGKATREAEEEVEVEAERAVKKRKTVHFA